MMGRSADLYRKLCASIAPTVFSHMEVQSNSMYIILSLVTWRYNQEHIMIELTFYYHGVLYRKLCVSIAPTVFSHMEVRAE